MLTLTDFQAVGDGVTLNTDAFARAIKAAKEKGEALYVPSGVFLTGTVNLDGVSLVLGEGAVILGSSDLADYPEQDYQHNEMGALRALIVCMHADGVSITGRGTIDLNGRGFYPAKEYNVPPTRVPMNREQVEECTYPIGPRPGQCIFFYDCTDVTVDGITILDAPNWTLSLHSCTDCRLTNLTIKTSLNIANDDGIHLCGCDGAIISGCHISSGDDCIALSSITDWNRPCKNVVISDCVLRSCSKAIVLGYIYSIIENVTISNCVIRESNRGITFMCDTHCGRIENVVVSNCVIDTKIRAGNWWGNGEPVFIMAVPQDMHLPAAQKNPRPEAGIVRNLRFENLVCTAENAIGIVGYDNIENVTLRGITYRRKPSKNLALKGSALDLSPSGETAEIPETCAVYIRGADVTLDEIDADGGETLWQD